MRSFLKGAGKSETRNDTQRVFLWGVLSVVLMVNHFYWFVLMEDDDQRVVQLEPHPSFFHYQAPRIRQFVAECVKKINFLEQHSRVELKRVS